MKTGHPWCGTLVGVRSRHRRLRLESAPLTDEFRSLAGAGRNESIRRAFQVLECLSLHPGASVAGVARETGLPRATVTRVLATLADVGAARRDGGGWTVGPGIAALARGIEPPLAERAGPHLAALAAELGETVMLAVPEGAVGARVVAEAAGPRMVRRGFLAGSDVDRPGVGLRPDATGGARPAGPGAGRGGAAAGRAHRIDDPVAAGAPGRARPDRAGRSRRGGRRVRAGPGRAGRPPSPGATEIVGLLAVYLPTSPAGRRDARGARSKRCERRLSP